MRNAGLDDTQAGIKIDGRNIDNLRYADDTTLMAESEEELKILLQSYQSQVEWVHWSEDKVYLRQTTEDTRPRFISFQFN